MNDPSAGVPAQTIRKHVAGGRVTFALGAKVGPYRVVRKIGSGGMGAVYEVVHEMLHQRFALKSFFLEGNSAQDRADTEARFLLEARVTSQMHHTGIVSVQTLDRDPETGLYYFVMEYVAMSRERRAQLLASAFTDGEAWRQGAAVPDASELAVGLSLEDLYRAAREKHQPINQALLRRLLLDVADALAYAHAFGAGILHRDIKPANILVRADGHAVIADFGVAKVLDKRLRGAMLGGQGRSLSLRMDEKGEAYHLILGTRDYMAPELLAGAPPSPQTDLFALGAVAYQLLTCEPFGPGAKEPSAFGVSRAWDKLVVGCLYHEPGDRWQSVAEFRDRLQQLDLDALPPKERRAARAASRAARKQAILMRRAARRAAGEGWIGPAAWGMTLLAALCFALFGWLRRDEAASSRAVMSFPEAPEWVMFEGIQLGGRAYLAMVHPDVCGVVEVPERLAGRQIRAILPDAIAQCSHVTAISAQVSLPPELAGMSTRAPEVLDNGRRFQLAPATYTLLPGGRALRLERVTLNSKRTCYLPGVVGGLPVEEMASDALLGVKAGATVVLPPTLLRVQLGALRKSLGVWVVLNPGAPKPGVEAYAEPEVPRAKEAPLAAAQPVQTQARRVQQPATPASKPATPAPKATIQHAGLCFQRGGNGSGLVLTAAPGPFTDDLIIPERVDNLPVVAIGKGAFTEAPGDFRRVVMPSTLQTIGQEAFAGKVLGEVVLNEGLKTLGERAFANCTIDKITFPASLETLPYKVFEGATFNCDIVLPGNISTLERDAFAQIDATHHEIFLSTAVTELPIGTFWEAKQIKSIHLPGVTTVPTFGLTCLPDNVPEGGSIDLFFQAPKVTFAVDSLSLAKRATRYNSVVVLHAGANTTFELEEGFLENARTRLERRMGNTVQHWSRERQAWVDGAVSRDEWVGISELDGSITLAICRVGYRKHLTVPARLQGREVRAISGATFDDCEAETIDLPDTIRYLHNAAFIRMTHLKRVVLPAQLDCSGRTRSRGVYAPRAYYAFQWCTALEEVVFQNPIDEIPGAFFSHCRSLKYVIIKGTDKPPKLDRDPFEDTPPEGVLMVLEPKGAPPCYYLCLAGKQPELLSEQAEAVRQYLASRAQRAVAEVKSEPAAEPNAEREIIVLKAGNSKVKAALQFDAKRHAYTLTALGRTKPNSSLELPDSHEGIAIDRVAAGAMDNLASNVNLRLHGSVTFEPDACPKNAPSALGFPKASPPCFSVDSFPPNKIPRLVAIYADGTTERFNPFFRTDSALYLFTPRGYWLYSLRPNKTLSAFTVPSSVHDSPVIGVLPGACRNTPNLAEFNPPNNTDFKISPGAFDGTRLQTK